MFRERYPLSEFDSLAIRTSTGSKQMKLRCEKTKDVYNELGGI
jgi:hypothetical protein